jgi:signal recognition particle receptor subunit alpha
VHLTWIDKLLDNVRALFAGLYEEQLKKGHTSVVDTDTFGPYFDRQVQELERANEATPNVKLTPPSSTENDSAEDNAPPVLQKPQRPLYDTSADYGPRRRIWGSYSWCVGVSFLVSTLPSSGGADSWYRPYTNRWCT